MHHQLDVHHYNYADIPLWDRLFGTYRDADEFVPQCGFPRGNDRRAGLLGAADLCGSRCHTYHFFTDCIVKRDPCQSQFRGKGRVKMLL